MTDDLLRPSVTAAPAGPRPNPWRISSQVWVAVFGGILAVTVIAILNAKRLGIDNRKRWLMAAAGVVALVIFGVLWFRVPLAHDFTTFAKQARELRMYGRIIAIALYFVLALMQKRAAAHWRTFTGVEYAPLWKAGIAASLILGLVQNLAFPGIAWLVRQ